MFFIQKVEMKKVTMYTIFNPILHFYLYRFSLQNFLHFPPNLSQFPLQNSLPVAINSLDMNKNGAFILSFFYKYIQ